MNYKFQYLNDDERTTIINQNQDKFLIIEENITEGKFLTFSDEQPIKPQLPEVQIMVKENDLNDIKQQQALMQQAIDDLILGGAL